MGRRLTPRYFSVKSFPSRMKAVAKGFCFDLVGDGRVANCGDTYSRALPPVTDLAVYWHCFHFPEADAGEGPIPDRTRMGRGNGLCRPS